MAWTIDESRVRPFLTAAERRDVTWTLWRLQTCQRALHGIEATAPIPVTSRKPRKDYKDFKDYKDGKDFKDGKDGKDAKDAKDSKDWKDSKDSKDSKDGKDSKDSKDGKEFKDSKDAKDGKDAKDTKDGKEFDRWAEPPHVLPRTVREVTGFAPGGGEADDILAILRASRATRFLRERGLVI